MRSPIPFPHLCVIARAEYRRAIDRVDWIERIKLALLAAGFTYPIAPDGIHAALRAVERTAPRGTRNV